MSDADQSPRRTIDHVQLAIPGRGDDVAHDFSAAKLGIPDVPEPPLPAQAAP